MTSYPEAYSSVVPYEANSFAPLLLAPLRPETKSTTPFRAAEWLQEAIGLSASS